jgi:hypothetical protein
MIRNASAGSCDVDRALACEPLALDVGLATCMSEPDRQRDALDDISPRSASLQDQVAHLPDNVVRNIARFALQSGGRQNSVLVLLAMCGVCRHWRQAASHVEKGTGLLFDGTPAQNSSTANVTTYEQKFRTLPQRKRTQILISAAKHLRGAFPSLSFAMCMLSSFLHFGVVRERATHGRRGW